MRAFSTTSDKFPLRGNQLTVTLQVFQFKLAKLNLPLVLTCLPADCCPCTWWRRQCQRLRAPFQTPPSHIDPWHIPPYPRNSHIPVMLPQHRDTRYSAISAEILCWPAKNISLGPFGALALQCTETPKSVDFPCHLLQRKINQNTIIIVPN